MNIVIGSDHGGFELKEKLIPFIRSKGHTVIDRGCPDSNAVDYPNIAFETCSEITGGSADRGILICGTGIGMSNAAGKVKGIIAALCTDPYMAKMSRLHNDANVLCLGARVIGDELAKVIVEAWLENEPLMDEKYVRRRKIITDHEQ